VPKINRKAGIVGAVYNVLTSDQAGPVGRLKNSMKLSFSILLTIWGETEYSAKVSINFSSF
jgi:hypothetical protein